MAKDDDRKTRQGTRKSPMDVATSNAAGTSDANSGDKGKGPKCSACSELGNGNVHHHWRHCPICMTKEDKSADIKARAAKLKEDAERTAASIRAARGRKGTVNEPFAPPTQPPFAPTPPPVNQQQQQPFAPPTQQPTQQPFAQTPPPVNQQQQQPFAPPTQPPVNQQQQPFAPPFAQTPPVDQQQQQSVALSLALAPAPQLQQLRYMGPPQPAYGLPPPPYGNGQFSQQAAGATATGGYGGEILGDADGNDASDDHAAPNESRIYGGWKYQVNGPPTPIPGLSRNMERPSKLESNTAQSKAMNQRFNAIAQKAEFMGDRVDAWIICVALPMRGMGEMRLYENDDMARDAPGVKDSIRRIVFDALQGKRMQRLSELKKEAVRVAEKVRVAESMARRKAKEAEKYKAQLEEAREKKAAKMKHAKSTSQKRRELKRKRAVRAQVTVVDLED